MYDIICIGSGVFDVFVKTKSKEIKKHKDHHDVCYSIGGKYLIDDIYFATGGGGSNAAVSFSRLGFKTGWIAKLGNDLNAQVLLDEAKKERIDFLGVQADVKTSYSVILIGLENDRTILTYKKVNEQLKISDVNFKKLKKTKWFYLTSFLGKGFKTEKNIVRYAKQYNIRYSFNPSLYMAKLGLKKLMPIIKGCDILILNKEEAQALLNSKKNIIDLLRILQRYSKIVVITDGAKGAHAYNGVRIFKIIPKKVKIVETTGAGDSFASGFVAGIMLNKSIEDSLKIAQAQASSVIQNIGSKNKLLNRNELNKAINIVGKVKVI